MQRVAVLMGGISPEHPVSLASGCGILAQLDPKLFQGFPVLISRDNEWMWPAAAIDGKWIPPGGWDAAMAAEILKDPPVTWARARFPRFNALPSADAYFIGLHGVGGEDGRLQGFLEMAGQPFTGSGGLGSALAMDKILSKQLYALHGIPTAKWVVLDTAEWTQREVAAAADRVEKEIGLPAVVKHPTGGSSIGVAVARTREALIAALAEIGKETPRLLAEAFVAGRESSCGVLEGFATALSPTEIRPRKDAFFSFEEKYAKGGAEEITPAEFPPAVIERIQKFARQAHQALRLSVYSRTDFIWVPDKDELFALETNNLPGFTPTSLLPQQAAHAGLSYRDLVTKVIEQSLSTPR
ncbi:MAG: D-alanine--D-alanine ligase [Fibrobacteria bacterium]|jgi:D-alanine-D-alanine ligase|nr:D-alanine--D-alanine ligase [Fibrobacteria bacterium]